MPAAFKMFCPPSLMDIVDAVWDLDVPDGDAAKALTIKYPPGTSILLTAQYRVPFRTDRRSGPSGHTPSKYERKFRPVFTCTDGVRSALSSCA